MFKQPVKLLFKQLSWLLMLCGCSKIIVKPGVKVITIESSADALWLGANSFVQTIRGSFVQQIEPAKDAMRMEEVVKRFSGAFEQNLNGELIYNLGKFPECLKGRLSECEEWFNHSRFYS